MAKATLSILKLLMILICAGWFTLWILKPTQLWTKKWHTAEDSARTTVFGYYGLNFVVYTFPVILLAAIGFVYMDLQSRESRRRGARTSASVLSNPLLVNSYLGVLSALEIIAVSLFFLYLAWTFYVHISNDFDKMVPTKSLKSFSNISNAGKKMNPAESLKLNMRQFKFLKVATRFGLLAEACLALLLLPVLRRMSLFRVLGIQFEASVRYHVWLGTAMIFFATFHGVSTLIVWGIKDKIKDEMWKWQKTGRIYLAGEIALIAGLIIWITSLPPIRRKRFEIFYYTHHLYIIFLLFFLFHAGDRHFYMVFGGVFLFGIDKLLRMIQSIPQSCIHSARVFPCNAIELVVPKDPRLKYSPTSIIFVKIPSISRFQWHSFSITSSSNIEDDTMSVIIKCGGWWTKSLSDMITAELDSGSDQMKCIPIAIEGPYGPASLDFLSYDSLVMVAGGVGVTPFLSILQEIASTQSSIRYRFPTRVQLIHTMKKSQDISLLNPILHLLTNQSAEKLHLKLKVFVTQEEGSGATIRELLNEFCQVQVVNFATKCSSYAAHGLENMRWMAAMAGLSSIMFLVFLSSLNHAFLPSQEKSSKQKNPSWVSDILLICSFIIAILCSTMLAIILKWRKLRREIPSVSEKEGKDKEGLMGTRRGSTALDEHEIHFGGRPNFQDILSNLSKESGGADTGVLVCGPESMKESVASICSITSQPSSSKGDHQKRRSSLSFHSLNFTL